MVTTELPMNLLLKC